MMSPAKAENPFVGLRPFESEDSLYYFGRNEQSRALLQQLHSNRFLAVVGASGSGKSSLVRAGLIPILEGGFLVQDRDTWQFATMKPGASPLANMAEALLSVQGEAATEDAGDVFEDKIRTRGVAAILDEIRPALDTRQTNLLLLVDQFEELFRFAANLDEREEAADFVNILLRLSEQTEVEIYVVLTMRSDFIGDCDRFQGLPEAMNRSQYLVPRLTRQQRREAIAGPVRLSRGKTAPRLLDKLLNETLDTRDDLPILQHALMRTWDNWAASGGEGPMDLHHYEAVGGVTEALNNHADEALSELNEDDQVVARRLFEALTETDSGNRKIRRPAHISEIAAITGASTERIERVIDTFREQGRSFLVRTRKPGRDEVLVDISHESLIRQWDRLRHWVEEEAEAASTYRRLAETAELHQRGRADIYRGIDFEVAMEWRAQTKPTRAWGERYHPGFDAALAFLAKSRQAYEEKLARAARIRKRRIRNIASVTATVIVCLSALTLYAWKQKKIAQRQNRIANYDLAKVVEGKAAAALDQVDAEGREYQQAWLSALVSLNQQNLPKDAAFPESMGMLSRWDLAAGAMANLWTSPPGDAPLRYAIFSPDGKHIVSGSEKGALTLWQHASSDAPPRRVDVPAFTDGSGPAYSLAFSPDGTTLATGSGKNIRIWDFSNPEKPCELGPIPGPDGEAPANVRELAFSPDGTILAVGAEDHTLRLWDLSDPGSPRDLEFKGTHDGIVYTVAFSPDGRILASGSEDKTIRLWNLSRLDSPGAVPMEILEGHRDSVSSVAFSPDGRTLASGARDRSIRIWDLSNPATPAELARIEESHAESVSQVVFSADGRTLASASYDSSIGLWDLSDPAAPIRRSVFKGHLSYVYTAAFSADGATLLSASDDTTVRLWDLAEPGTLQKSTGHSDYVNSVAISPDGGILASASRDNTVRLWTLSPQAAPRELSVLREHGDFVYCVAISPDGKILASGSRDTDIRLFSLDDPASPSLLATLSGDESGATGHASWVLSLAFSPDSKTLASGSYDKTLRVWNTENPATPRQATVIKDFESLISTAAFSPDGTILAAGSYDKTIRLYDFSEPNAPLQLSVLPGPSAPVSCLSFSPGGSILATGSADGAIRLWDLADVNAPHEMVVLRKHTAPVNTLAFSPDGKTLASGSADKTIRLWDLAPPESPGELAVLRGHTETVSSVAFSPDGGTLFSGSRDNAIRLWKLDGPFNDYRHAGQKAPGFQGPYRVSFELLPYRLEGISLVPKKTLSEYPEPFPYRPPGLHPFTWIQDGAAD